MNNVTIIGRLAQNPTAYNYNNTYKTLFTIAVTRTHNREKTDFINCVAWNKLAQIINNNCKQGDKIAIQGEIRQDKYTNNKGEKKEKLIINVEKMEYCGKKIINENSTTFQNIEEEPNFPWEI